MFSASKQIQTLVINRAPSLAPGDFRQFIHRHPCKSGRLVIGRKTAGPLVKSPGWDWVVRSAKLDGWTQIEVESPPFKCVAARASCDGPAETLILEEAGSRRGRRWVATRTPSRRSRARPTATCSARRFAPPPRSHMLHPCRVLVNCVLLLSSPPRISPNVSLGLTHKSLAMNARGRCSLSVYIQLSGAREPKDGRRVPLRPA